MDHQRTMFIDILFGFMNYYVHLDQVHLPEHDIPANQMDHRTWKILAVIQGMVDQNIVILSSAHKMAFDRVFSCVHTRLLIRKIKSLRQMAGMSIDTHVNASNLKFSHVIEEIILHQWYTIEGWNAIKNDVCVRIVNGQSVICM